MKTSYFTFGQSHIHRVNGFTFDCDVIVEITAEDPRDVMFSFFGDKWGMQYDSCPDLEYFPRGIKKLEL